MSYFDIAGITYVYKTIPLIAMNGSFLQLSSISNLFCQNRPDMPVLTSLADNLPFIGACY